MEQAAILPGIQTVMRERLTRDARLQFRGSLDMSRIADFASEMQDGTQFDPVIVFYDGTTAWLSDGYHRDAAADSLDWQTIEADIREGTFLEALFYAYRANAAPGHKQLTARERREGLQRLIEAAPNLSTYQIAEQTGVDQSTVSRTKSAMFTNANALVGTPRLVTGRDGRTQDVARIGRRPTVDDDEDAPDLFSAIDDANDTEEFDADDPIARASQLAREHPSVKWPEAMERLYKFMIGARNAGGFAAMIQEWRPEYRESSRRQIDRVIQELTAWRALLEDAR